MKNRLIGDSKIKLAGFAFIFLPVFFAGSARAQETAAEIPLPFFEFQNLPEKITLRVEDSGYDLSRSEMESWIKEETALGYSPIYRSEIENVRACEKKNALCGLLLPAQKENRIQKTSSFLLNEKAAEKFLEDLARQANKDPQNAKLQVENGKASLFTMSSSGIRLKIEGSLPFLIDRFAKNDFTGPIDLAYEKIPPEISIDSIDNLGITSLIGEGKSNFQGSPRNRIFNIKVATTRFHGALIKPGEEFSFVKILGEVDGEHGYLPELVIKKDKTEPEFGGGICQVSTTAFRAAINSGLKITARRNHAYPVKYYDPQGMDATVYVPRPDLKFINNTPGHILIQTKIEGTQLSFQFYGTADGRKISVDGPAIIEKKPDGSMKTVFSQKVYDSGGKLFIEDSFSSAYDSPAKYPHPGEVLAEKPDDWSDKEWKKYKKEHNI